MTICWGSPIHLPLKGFSLNALLDIKQGGMMYNGTKNVMNNLGTHKDTENQGRGLHCSRGERKHRPAQ